MNNRTGSQQSMRKEPEGRLKTFIFIPENQRRSGFSKMWVKQIETGVNF